MPTPDDKWIRAEAETIVREDGAEHDYDYKAGRIAIVEEHEQRSIRSCIEEQS